ncbi:MAG: 2,3-bisphosphoglycerate-independent phosphoglycerate mutase [Clostridiales bacterium]|mgnify:CR=1 FL=1|nr:2,3-bisphosphoglycerate-independent phosphoglycerate mutase [Clostridiales bacterium]
MKKRFHAIIIMDGFAFTEDKEASAIEKAGIPNIKRLMGRYSHTVIGASGMDVGLPHGQMGNSEVGHLNIGAGRIVYQEYTRITKAIEDGDFFDNEVLNAAIDHVKKTGGKLHIMGLLSDGGVHSHNTHLYALLELAKRAGLENAYVHCFTDGRDVSPTSGAGFIKELYELMQAKNFGRIASVSGRYYAMDRDNRWERVKKAYDLLTEGIGERAKCPYEAMKDSYRRGVTDEFIVPFAVEDECGNAVTVKEGDAVIFFNFRPDRARELTRAFTENEFKGFLRKKLDNLYFVCMTQYDVTFKNVHVAFRPQSLDNTLGEVLSERGYSQLRIAETEKYAHVTFFFNGGVEKPNPCEDRILVPSPKVATYDLKPEMSAYEVTEKALEAIASGKYDVMILNFANCDMVGHTGVMDAAINAVMAVDECVGRLCDAILKTGGMAIVTADHGNADKMVDEDGKPFTAHSTNPVPFIVVDDQNRNVRLEEGGRLADIAPTLLYIMGEEIPKEMTGKVLIKPCR